LFIVAFVSMATPAAAQESAAETAQTGSLTQPAPLVLEMRMVETPVPKSVKGLFGSYAALQGLDIYSTSAALRRGAREANPLMRTSMKQAIAFKAAMNLTTYYVVNKMSRNNRKAAIVTMVILNGVTAAVVANNMRNARR
jgi:hypothetical protein